MGAKACPPQQQAAKQTQPLKSRKLPEKHQQGAATGKAMKNTVILNIAKRLGEDLLPSDAPPLEF